MAFDQLEPSMALRIASPRMDILGNPEPESASADFVLGARDFSRRGGRGLRKVIPVNGCR